jgi:group I intron endonuclease
MNSFRSGIYLIRSKVSKRLYVGSAVDIPTRWIQHIYNLRLGNHKNRHLQRAWNKYKEESFSFEVLLYCDKQNLILYEQRAMDYFSQYFGWRTLYNDCPVAGSRLGSKMRDDTKENLRAYMKGNKYTKGRKISDEHRAKISASLIGNTHTKGFKPTAEQIEKWRESRKGYRHSEETRLKMSISSKGKIVSDETRQKLSISHKGKKRSPEAIAKSSLSMKGHTVSEETRRKLSESGKLGWIKRKMKQSNDNQDTPILH